MIVMRKRMILWLLLCLLPFTVISYANEDTPAVQVKAKACIVMDMDTGRVLYGLNGREQLPMASTTKIMSALLTLEQPNLDEEFVVDPNAIKVEGSSMGLVEGDIVTLRSLAVGMLLPSGNDAANAAAVRIGGSIENFVAMMNQRAQELHMENTHFVTPSGLDDEEHYTTAYDLALLAKEAMQNELFRSICSQYRVQAVFGNPPYQRYLTNHNKLLERYEYAVGVKTGYTQKAKRCLVSAAEKDGKSLICVTLSAEDDWNVHEKLFEFYFDQLSEYSFADKIDAVAVPVTGGKQQTVGVYAQENCSVFTLPKEDVLIEVRIPQISYAPIAEGAQAGVAAVLVDGAVVKEIPLYFKQTVERVALQKTGWFEWIKNLFD